MPRRRQQSGPSLEGLGGALIGVTVSYLGVEAALPGNLHPVHWVVTAVGGGVGYAVGHAVLVVQARRARPVAAAIRHRGHPGPHRTTGRPRRRRR